MSRRLFLAAVAATLAALLLAAAYVLRPDVGGDGPRVMRTEGAGGLTFVPNETCAECHADVSARWTGSHHDRAMQVATPTTVLGDFDDTAFTHLGVTSRFFVRDGRFFVNTEGPDGTPTDFEIAYTFGVEPLQQYLIPFEGGRLQSLTIAWDTERGEWFHLYPDERVEPGDALHWTGAYQTWNSMCAECHSTDLRTGFDRDTGTYDTTWAEIDVSCQACHGPGSAHTAWARDEGMPPTDRALSATGLLVAFDAGDPAGEVDRCARCHSRRSPVSVEDTHGRPFLDDFSPATLREGLYHADGQILDEVYVYGSFVQSKMHAAGVRCSDCHDPHALELEATGNAVCARCHRPAPPTAFPTLTSRDYDAPSHHFHVAGSPGASCVSCHMPTRTYMVVDPRRDHGFRIPRPDVSVAIGAPDACTACHTAETQTWAAERAAEWWGAPPPGDQVPETIAAGRRGERDAELPLVALSQDETRPALLRATALELLRGYGGLATQAMVRASRDAEPLVRAAAIGGLLRLPPAERVVSAGPGLRDPTPIVRAQAARVLADVSAANLGPEMTARRNDALVEYRAVQVAHAGLPSSNLNLGALANAVGRPAEAEAAYRAALALDAAFLPAVFNLVNLYNQDGRNGAAEALLTDAIAGVPAAGELHYSLGLLLAEEQRLEEAADSLGRAAALLPERARVHYNHGLALQQLGRMDEAERPLLEALRVNPRDPGVSQALAIFYLQRQDWEAARLHAERLRDLLPGQPGPQQLINQIQVQRLQSER